MVVGTDPKDGRPDSEIVASLCKVRQGSKGCSKGRSPARQDVGPGFGHERRLTKTGKIEGFKRSAIYVGAGPHPTGYDNLVEERLSCGCEIRTSAEAEVAGPAERKTTCT
jgi:hypothetical protein